MMVLIIMIRLRLTPRLAPIWCVSVVHGLGQASWISTLSKRPEWELRRMVRHMHWREQPGTEFSRGKLTWKAAQSILNQDYVPECSLADAKLLAVRVLMKTMDSTTLSSDKCAFFQCRFLCAVRNGFGSAS